MRDERNGLVVDRSLRARWPATCFKRERPSFLRQQSMWRLEGGHPALAPYMTATPVGLRSNAACPRVWTGPQPTFQQRSAGV